MSATLIELVKLFHTASYWNDQKSATDNVGEAVGATVGVKDGARVGEAEIASVGPDVGAEEGWVGISVGWLLGAQVGWPEGTQLG